jgi:hypothetical protein
MRAQERSDAASRAASAGISLGLLRGGHHSAHARQAGITRDPKAAERSARRQGAENNGAGQARLEQIGLTRPPCLDIIYLEGDSDAEQQWQRDDVRKIERQVEKSAQFQRHHPRDEKRDESQYNVANSAQRDVEQYSDHAEGKDPRLDERLQHSVRRFIERDRRTGRARRETGHRPHECV